LRNRNNTPSDNPKEYYKIVLAILLLVTLLVQIEERFFQTKNTFMVFLVPYLLHDDEDPCLDNFYIGNNNFPSINLSLMR